MHIKKQLSVATGHSTFNPVTALRSVPGCHWKKTGLTLVELLVTISIMGLVIAVSIPMVRPMMVSNKVKSGADVVAGFLAQARNRAIEENRPVGVTFERILNYEDNGAYPYNGASVLMRQVAEPKPLSGFGKDVRVAVDTSGQIIFRVWNPNVSPPRWDDDLSEITYWNKLVHPGDQIQFDGKGPKYEIMAGYTINMNVNQTPPVYAPDQPALFKVFRKPRPGKVAPTMATPVAMPEGIVVDLDASGMGKRLCDARNMVDSYGGDNYDWTAVRDDFCARDQADKDSVTIMFSPTGEVDRVYYSSKPYNNITGAPADPGVAIPSGPIYLNIGIWERAGFWEDDGGWKISNLYLPESDHLPNCDMRNYRDMNNYWVTIFPRTGAVRVNRVANTDSSPQNSKRLTDSRRFANSLHGAETR